MMARAEAMQGLWENELVLHHPHSFPQKAITPAKVLQRSCSRCLCSFRCRLAC